MRPFICRSFSAETQFDPTRLAKRAPAVFGAGFLVISECIPLGLWVARGKGRGVPNDEREGLRYVSGRILRGLKMFDIMAP